jgi:hypothetical protein
MLSTVVGPSVTLDGDMVALDARSVRLFAGLRQTWAQRAQQGAHPQYRTDSRSNLGNQRAPLQYLSPLSHSSVATTAG